MSLTASRRLFKKLYHVDLYDYHQDRLWEAIELHLPKQRFSLLDAACGFGNPFVEKINAAYSVGADIDPAVCAKNHLHRQFIIQDLHLLETDLRFDVILSLYTWEHLQHPEKVLDNFARILNKNGTIIILASQRWHYVSVLARILPAAVHRFAWRFFKSNKRVPFPIFNRMCSRRSLKKAIERQGMKLAFFMAVEPPPLWFVRIPPLFFFGCVWMSLVNRFRAFQGLRGTFLVVMKNETTDTKT